MKKKILPLALTLIICLGVHIPASAAEVKTIMLEKFGIVMTLNGYLRTERYKTSDGITETVYVVEDGSTTEFSAMDGFRYLPNEDLLTHTGEFFDYITAYGSGVGSGYACYSFGNEWYPLTGPVTNTAAPIKNGAAYGMFDFYYCTIICESDFTRFMVGGESIPDPPTAKLETASPTNDKLTVNGILADPTVYKIGDSNYFKIRDMAALLNGTEKQFSVGYDSALNSVTATTGQGYEPLAGDLAGAASGGNQTAAPSNDTIYVNGQNVNAEVYKINGSNYFKLRDLGKALNFYVGWSTERGMYIETDKPYSE